MDVATETFAVDPNVAVEGQPQEAFEVQHVAPASVVYSAAPVSYMAPTMVAPPAMVSHYTWNGEQYPSMEAALAAMMDQASKAAAAPAVEEEPKEESKEEPEEETEVKKRSVK